MMLFFPVTCDIRNDYYYLLLSIGPNFIASILQHMYVHKIGEPIPDHAS